MVHQILKNSSVANQPSRINLVLTLASMMEGKPHYHPSIMLCTFFPLARAIMTLWIYNENKNETMLQIP
jgi:hypothetical protein